MLAIGVDIQEIVDDVGGGGAEAEAEEGYECAGDEAGGQGVGEEEGEEDEDIFRPLVNSEGLEPGFDGRRLLAEDADGETLALRSAAVSAGWDWRP